MSDGHILASQGTLRDTIVRAALDCRALLNRMCELVRNQLSAFGAVRFEFVFAEKNMAANGKGVSI
ncbi:MAG TPA: hypothetical protein VIS96_12335 [Terrimicrobiaceae bacterium]